jgi:aspartyl-tRNA(Asn)/glutamyl-tRNA(Gln) amidotransferase subunit C
MDAEQVRWVAHLSRLRLSDEELGLHAGHLSAVLAFVEQLNQVDTAGVEPLAHPLGMTGVFRDDEPRPSLMVDEALANAPARAGDFFGVPAVLD